MPMWQQRQAMVEVCPESLQAALDTRLSFGDSHLTT